MAVVGQPAVIGPAGGCGQLRVLDRPGKQAQAGIQKGCVNAVEVHVLHAGVGIEAALAALGVLQVNRHLGRVPPLAVDLFAHADRPDQAEAGRRAEQFALDLKAVLAVAVNNKRGRPVAVARIDIFLPEVTRFQNMAVRINDIIGASHTVPPVACI